MGESLDMEIESRPGRVVLRFTNSGETIEYPLAVDSAAGLADRISQAAERARELE